MKMIGNNVLGKKYVSENYRSETLRNSERKKRKHETLE